MATQKQREKRRRNRMKKHQDPETLESDLSEIEEGETVVKETEEETEPLEKDYTMSMPMPGPTSYAELEAAEAAREQAEQVRRESWTVQDLVYNIAYHPEMSADDKSKAIMQVGKDFGKRLKSIASDDMEKQLDLDLLETRALIAKESRSMSMLDSAIDLFQRAKLTAAAENKLSDDDFALVYEEDGKKVRKYPIHDKAHVRNALARAAQMIEAGGKAASDARKALPRIKAAAKKMGIGVSKSIMIEKDVSGQWRAVLFPSNNFKDRDGEIIAKAAHEEYVEWINKNMADAAPVFATWHVPGTARTYPMDFVGFDNGFLVESCPLTEAEAGALLKMQEAVDIGLSIGGVALERDPDNPHVILKYRQFEVSDLPLARAANPFTDVEVIVKEAHMNSVQMKEYLAGMLGAERAEAVVSKMALTQKELQDAGVEEKEVKTPDPQTPAAPAETKPAAAASVNIDEIVERVSKEFGMEELSKQFQTMKEQSEKVPVLEELVKQLVASKEDDLASMIQPPVSRQLSWMGTRPSQSKENVLNKDKKEDEELKKSQPELGWLSEATGTQPVQVQ